MYVITGATGNTGRAVAEILLAAGKPVRVIGRSEDKLKALADKGAETAVGSLEDEGFLVEAFNGEHYGITFEFDEYYKTDGDTSFGGDVRYRHDWNDAGWFRLQVSLRDISPPILR